MGTSAEKAAFLQERVGYELAMLNYTFMRVVTARPSTSEEQLDRNAFLEAFAVHARNLVGFLSPKSQAGDRNATDYVTDFEAPDQSRLERPLLRLEKEILNVAASRMTAPEERFTADDARELYTWIVPAILKFEEKLPPRYRASLNTLGSAPPAT
jgi:hypothetical protein